MLEILLSIFSLLISAIIIIPLVFFFAIPLIKLIIKVFVKLVSLGFNIALFFVGLFLFVLILSFILIF